MKWFTAIVVAIAMAALFPLQGRAAFDLSWGTGQPTSPGAGMVTGTGTFHVDTGYTVFQFIIFATPVAGGQSDMQPCRGVIAPLQAFMRFFRAFWAANRVEYPLWGGVGPCDGLRSLAAKPH